MRKQIFDKTLVTISATKGKYTTTYALTTDKAGLETFEVEKSTFSDFVRKSRKYTKAKPHFLVTQVNGSRTGSSYYFDSLKSAIEYTIRTR